MMICFHNGGFSITRVIFLAGLCTFWGGAAHAQSAGGCAEGEYKTTIKHPDKVDYLEVGLDPSIVLVTTAPSSKPAEIYPSATAPLSVPCVSARLTPVDLGVVINENDPYSVTVGNYYIQKRNIPQANVLRLNNMPVGVPELTASQFSTLHQQVDAFFGSRVQALALVWQKPFAVETAGKYTNASSSAQQNGVHFNCNNSITFAVTFGEVFENFACGGSGGFPGKVNPYFNSSSYRPYQDFGLRISMLLSAIDEIQAKALIDRGVASDGLYKQDVPYVPTAYFVKNPSESARNVRVPYFPQYPASGIDEQAGVKVNFNVLNGFNELKGFSDIFFYQIGLARFSHLNTLGFLPGALGDSLTSFGGILYGNPSNGNGDPVQTSLLEWIKAGVTATFGTTSEPYANTMKFPDPRVLYLTYTQGSTAIESYWRSVEVVQQGLFVGEPLAAPFGKK